MATTTQPPNHQPWNSYPNGLERTHKSKGALAVYHDRVAREERDIFVSDGKPRFVVLWDQPENEDGVQDPRLLSMSTQLTASVAAFETELKIESQQQLTQAMSGSASPDPNCRFM